MPGRIRDEDIAAVRERVPLEQVVGDHVALRNAGGGRLKGLVPVPRREDAVVHRQPLARLLQVLRLRGIRRRRSPSSARSTTSTSPTPSRCSRAGSGSRSAASRAARPRTARAGQRQRLLDAHAAAAEFFAAQLPSPEARDRPDVPHRARLRRGRLGALRRRLRPERLGHHAQAPARQGLHRRRAARRRARQPGPARADRPVPRPAGLADPGPQGRRDRLRRAPAPRGRQRPEVSEHPRDAALQEEPGAVRRRPRQARHRERS